MRRKSRMAKAGFLLVILLLVCDLKPMNADAKEEDMVSNARKGIVEIYSGFLDGEGAFHKMKYGSGFLISNDEDGTCIATCYSILENSKEEKERYCAVNMIEMDNYQMSDVIRIVVKDDVTVDASILAKSEEWDFAILSAGQSVNAKVPLKLGDNSRLVTGDNVYALGYPELVTENDIYTLGYSDNPHDISFSETDVEIFQGSIQNKEAARSGKSYIQHSARISEGNTGGPLLDADGYVVGINCRTDLEEDSERYFAVPANAVMQVLDNFEMNYTSREQEESAQEKKLQTIIYILLGAILLLFSCLISILILNQRDKKRTVCSEEYITDEQFPDRGKEHENNRGDRYIAEKNVRQSKSGVLDDEREEEKTIGLSFYRQAENVIRNQYREFSSRTTDIEMIQIRNKQAAIVDKPEYIIGKSKEQADFVIMENRAVSRKHACISWEHDAYFIRDMGSSNGTYLHGKKLPEGEAVKLSDGDSIMLADEKFQVRIYGTKSQKGKEHDISC